jgi:hypothetical protein
MPATKAATPAKRTLWLREITHDAFHLVSRRVGQSYSPGFRRLKAYKHLPALRVAPAAHQSKYVTQRVEHDADAAWHDPRRYPLPYFNKIWGIP